MALRIKVAGILLLLGAAEYLCGQSAAPLQVTTSDVIAGMRTKDIVVRPSQVSMLSSIPVSTEHPQLEAVKVESLTADTSRVLMRCVDRTSCIPFYVVVSGLVPTQQVSEPPSKARGLSSRGTSGPVVVKRGAKVTMEIVSPEMVITLPVVCLQSGHLGEKIKATSPDQKITYLGEIVSPKLLRGRL